MEKTSFNEQQRVKKLIEEAKSEAEKAIIYKEHALYNLSECHRLEKLFREQKTQFNKTQNQLWECQDVLKKIVICEGDFDDLKLIAKKYIKKYGIS